MNHWRMTYYWLLEQRMPDGWQDIFCFEAANIDDALAEFAGWTDPHGQRENQRFRPISADEAKKYRIAGHQAPPPGADGVE